VKAKKLIWKTLLRHSVKCRRYRHCADFSVAWRCGNRCCIASLRVQLR